MSALPDSMLISELSIPGTHDSGCEDNHSAADAGFAECQDADIIDQLRAGVRFLDLRVDATNDRWEIYHAGYQFRDFKTVLDEIDSFLAENERETVLCRISVWRGDRYNWLSGYQPIGLESWKQIAEDYDDRIWQVKDAVRADGVTPTTYAHAATENVTWSVLPWSDDNSSGIETNNLVYAYNFGSASDVTINGVTVTGISGTDPAVTDVFSSTGLNQVGSDTNALTSGLGGSATMAATFLSDSAPGSLTFQNLTPGLRYKLSLFSAGSGSTPCTATFESGLDRRSVDAHHFGQDAGLRLDYAFTADSSSRTLTWSSTDPDQPFPFYGYALNCVVGGGNFNPPGGDYGLIAINPTFHWPTLGEVRGKMVMFFMYDPLLIENKGHASGLGWASDGTTRPDKPIDGFQITVRDDFLNSDWGDKQQKDIDHIIQASDDLNPKALYATGLNIGYTGITPSGHAEVMNRYLLNQLNSDTNYLRKTGLVLMDYPGPGLLDSIIALNFRHATSSAAVYDDFVPYALNLPFEDKIVSDSVANGVPIATIWRRLVKERLPSTEFNTYIVTVNSDAPGAALAVSSSISPTDKNVLAGERKFEYSFQAIFESSRLPPKVTKNQVKQKLDALYIFLRQMYFPLRNSILMKTLFGKVSLVVAGFLLQP